MTKEKKKKPVVVFDCHRGIYFGYLKKVDEKLKTVTLENARHCYYFGVPRDETQRGAYSLASYGPAGDSKIGPRVTMQIFDISKIVDCTKEAVARWEAAKW